MMYVPELTVFIIWRFFDKLQSFPGGEFAELGEAEEEEDGEDYERD